MYISFGILPKLKQEILLWHWMILSEPRRPLSKLLMTMALWPWILAIQESSGAIAKAWYSEGVDDATVCCWWRPSSLHSLGSYIFRIVFVFEKTRELCFGNTKGKALFDSPSFLIQEQRWRRRCRRRWKKYDRQNAVFCTVRWL